MAAVVSRCYTAATRSIAAISVLVAVVTNTELCAIRSDGVSCARHKPGGVRLGLTQLPRLLEGPTPRADSSMTSVP